MKRKLLFTIMLGVILLTGCRNKNTASETTISEEPTATTIAETVAETLSTAQTTTGTPAKTETETESQPQDTVRGVVYDAAMSSVVIKLEDGSLLTLQRDGCEIISGDGLDIDDIVEVTYEGNQAVRIEELKQ